MKIQSRPIRGNEHESSWPPAYGSGEPGLYHLDKETGELVEGYSPCNIERYGEAPYVIQDSIKPYYHPAAEAWVDSRSGLKHMDKATGCITSDKMIPSETTLTREYQRARKEDHHRCLRKAVAAIDSGTAPLSEETRALCDQQNEIVSAALGFDAYNVAGRKTNAKGKRFRRK